MSKRNKPQEKIIGYVVFLICIIVYLLIRFGGCSMPLTPEEERTRRALGVDKKEFMKLKRAIEKEL